MWANLTSRSELTAVNDSTVQTTPPPHGVCGTNLGISRLWLLCTSDV